MALPTTNELFEFTSGRWVFNESHRLTQRRTIFHIEGLCRLAATSVNRSADDVLRIDKLAEGGFNRVLLITMRDGFSIIARVPYPLAPAKGLSIASEVATLDFLHAKGVPVPKVYGYSPTPDNEAKTEYIFMEFIKGSKLTDVLLEMDEGDIVRIMHQLVELEDALMNMSFPAAGSLYYTEDLRRLSPVQGTPVDANSRFCVGPDMNPQFWYGKRSQLDVDRGPFHSSEALFSGAARKEIAYLEQFAAPMHPVNRGRRIVYGFKEQSPSDHAENLRRFLLLAPSLNPNSTPVEPEFTIRHPDVRPNNVLVSMEASQESGQPSTRLKIISLIDWQYTSVYPPYLLAGIPEQIRYDDDPISDALIPPPPPDLSSEDTAGLEEYVHFRRLLHHHYATHARSLHNPYLMAHSVGSLFNKRLFYILLHGWEGETINLKRL